MKKICLFALLLTFGITGFAQKKTFESEGKSLSVEILADGVYRLQYTVGKAKPGNIPHTVMITDEVYNNPVTAKWVGNKVATNGSSLAVDLKNLYIDVVDKKHGELTTIKPVLYLDSIHGIMGTITPQTSYYGLGEQFSENNSSINYRGKIKEGDEYGNRMLGFNGGGGPNIQMPILYALENSTFKNYAVFVDNFYKQKFDLTNNEHWYDIVREKTINFYVFTGNDIKELHEKFINLTAKPLMIPRKMFGMWISEFGFDNWAEVDDKIKTLRENKFPVDGAVFDLQWFGAEQYKERNDTMPLFEKVHMGRLAWDEKNFPNPTAKLKSWEKDGLGAMVIQEPYVARHLKDWDEYEKNNVLVKDSAGKTGYIFQHAMWFSGGTGGGMFDYTSPSAGDYIFKNRILKLINMGLVGNWLDLGEPEHFQPWAKYHVGSHKEANNQYSLLWQKSIHDGYAKYGVDKRPFMMCRTGAPGMQRFGATLWNGDPMLRAGNLMATGANWANLALTGTFYYSSCAGGFYHRPDPFIDTSAFYTRWYAYSCLFDQPIWPHNFNPHNVPDEAAPDRIGDFEANLFATRQRYEMVPYYYSLGYRAYKTGAPVYAPLIYHYQKDANVKDLGSQLMIGEHILGGIPQTYNATTANIYLPKDVWYNFHTNAKSNSKGEWVKVPYFADGFFKVPGFTKAGAIIPKMHVDEKTQNALGKRSDGTVNNDLIVTVVPDKRTSSFDVYEDDGVTVDYIKGINSVTKVTQQIQNNNNVVVRFSAAKGNYKPFNERNYIVELMGDNKISGVTVNSKALPLLDSEDAFNRADYGYIRLKNGVVRCKSGNMSVASDKVFIFLK